MMSRKLPPLLTARNCKAAVRAVFADEGYTGAIDVREGAGWIEVTVGASATDAAIESAGARLSEIKNAGVELRIKRSVG